MASLDYIHVTHGEPHAQRAREMLAAHPELRELSGPTLSTALWIFTLVVIQFGLAFVFGNSSWMIWMPVAYLAGATINHALWVLIHDACHNLVFRWRPANRLVAILANLPLVVPGAVSFGKYHLLHHRHMGDLDFDAGIPGPTEARVIGRSGVAKAAWLAGTIFIQGIVRPSRMKRVTLLDGWTAVNIVIQVGTMALIVYIAGGTPFKYLAMSSVFAIGLHPLGARWIQEHFALAPDQETYSYYGPLNRLSFNVGYHNEHHDMVNVPWSRLPRIRGIAPEFYDGLQSYSSWTTLLVRFVRDSNITLYNAIVRPGRRPGGNDGGEASPKRAIAEAIRAIPIEWFKASPATYWADLLSCATIGWGALVLGAIASGWLRALMLTVAVFGLYRAVLFIHEITHRAPRDVPAFALVWNALVGVPLLVPSFMYERIHMDHHRQRSYGTDADPEYIPFGRRSPLLVASYVIGSILAPIAFAFRFAILAPLGWAIPPLGRFVAGRCSALVINHHYMRRPPIGVAGRVQEFAVFAVCWIAAALWWNGLLPASALLCYAGISGAVSGVNAARTLAAHRYDNESEELSMDEQLLDSCTIPPSAVLGQVGMQIAKGGRALVAPVGLRYHALHHWIPSLPYHNLGRAHRFLVTALKPDAPYRRTIEDGFTPVIRDLLRRAGSSSRPRA